MEVTAIVAARMGSSRFPGKSLALLGGMPMIEFLLRRLQKSKECKQIILATTVEKIDDPIEILGNKIGVDVFRGPENDVAGRFVEAAEMYEAEWVARITGDCPFVDGLGM